MKQVGDVLVSDEVFEKKFVCNIEKCKGACCVEGDLGAPLEEKELDILDDIYEEVKPYLDDIGIKAIEEQGKYVMDFQDEYSTPVIDGKECAYAIYDDGGTLHCAIEQAYNDGKIKYKKPISCHLYPIRILNLSIGDALNYDEWSICSDACDFGEHLGVKVYQFLKDPLIRKYGKEWYQQLEVAAERL